MLRLAEPEDSARAGRNSQKCFRFDFSKSHFCSDSRLACSLPESQAPACASQHSLQRDAVNSSHLTQFSAAAIVVSSTFFSGRYATSGRAFHRYWLNFANGAVHFKILKVFPSSPINLRYHRKLHYCSIQKRYDIMLQILQQNILRKCFL